MDKTQQALMEGARNAASEEYFGARPQIDCTDRRRVFEAGFDRAYKELLPTVCGCTTATHAHGRKEAYCGSADMTQVMSDGERFRWLLEFWWFGHDGISFDTALTPDEVRAAIDTEMSKSECIYVAAPHVVNGPACDCREGECESKPAGCRMTTEVAQRDPAVM